MAFQPCLMTYAIPMELIFLVMLCNCKSMSRFNVINYSIRYLCDRIWFICWAFCFLFHFRIEVLLAHLITELDYNRFKFRQTVSSNFVLVLSVKYQCGLIWLMIQEWKPNNGKRFIGKRNNIYILFEFQIIEKL